MKSSIKDCENILGVFTVFFTNGVWRGDACRPISLLNKPSPLGKHLQALGAKLRRWVRRRWMRFNPTGSLLLWRRWARSARMRFIPKGICYNNAGPAMGCSIPALRTVSHQIGSRLRRRNDGESASVRNLTAAQIDFVLMWHVATLIHGITRMSPAQFLIPHS